MTALEGAKSPHSSKRLEDLDDEIGQTRTPYEVHGREAIRGNVEFDRQRVIAYLRPRFGRALSEEDFEDVAQEAWSAVLRRERQGETIRDPLAFMRSVAWRTARDLIRDRHETAVDPSDRVLEATEDPNASPATRMSQRIDLVRAIEAVEQLPAAERAAYRTRFLEELSTREACRRLGVPRSTYHDRLRRAIESVHATLAPERFAELERSLIASYIAGLASRAERRRAERLIRTDPHAAALARELHRAHEATALSLSPVALDGGSHAGLIDRLAAAPGRARDLVVSITGRGPEVSDVAGPSTIAGGSGRGAGAAGATGLLSKLAGLGSAGKIAAACLGTGAAATACVAAGVVPGADLIGDGGRGPKPAVVREASPASKPEALPIPAEPGSTPPGEQPSPGSGVSGPATPQPPPQTTTTETPPAPAPVAPSAPPAQQEFGVAGAAAASSGSSASTGGGAAGGGSAAAREFGP